MQKRSKRTLYINIVSDALMTFLSYLCAIWLRFDVLGGVVSVSPWKIDFVITAAVYSAVIVGVYGAARLYSGERSLRRTGFLAIPIINGFGVLILMALLYVVRIMDFSRLALVIFWLISSGVIAGKRFILLLLLRSAQRSGRNLKHVIVAGSGHLASQYVHDILTQQKTGCRIEGTVGAAPCPGSAHLGDYGQLPRILAENPIDEVVVALEAAEYTLLEQILQAAGHEGVRLTLIPIFNDYIPANPTVHTLGSTTLINLRSTRLDHPGWAMVKRGMDIAGSLVLLLLFSPVMLFTAMGVQLSSPGPVIFRQQRIGRDKRPFDMLKFRSMRLNTASETAWSTAADPRKTRFGKFIRKYSLDELPQLLNVLKGDMSLVGPRPEIPYHVERFKEHIPLYLVRQQIRPGMTGWAQVNSLRGDTSIETRVEYDIWYIENWSLWLDIKILLKTALGGMRNPSEGG